MDDADHEQAARIRELLDNPVSFAALAGYEIGSEAATQDVAGAAVTLGMRSGLAIAAEQLEQLAARLRSHAEAPRDDTQPEKG